MHLLERELGAPLFERMRSGAALTDAGRAFLPHAEALLAAMRDGIDAVSETRGVGRGAVEQATNVCLVSLMELPQVAEEDDLHERLGPDEVGRYSELVGATMARAAEHLRRHASLSTKEDPAQ